MKPTKTLSHCLAYADSVQRKYRASLLAIGKSPDTHIYDLTPERIEGRGMQRERNFLLRALRFYHSLLPKDKQIFVNEVLERSRHYSFWFLEDYREKEFAKRKDSVLRRVCYAL